VFFLCCIAWLAGDTLCGGSVISPRVPCKVDIYRTQVQSSHILLEFEYTSGWGDKKSFSYGDDMFVKTTQR